MMFEHLIWLKETDSTQEVLKRGNFPYGTVVVADVQKKGKGRRGRKWESQEGGLYFSFVISAEDFNEPLQIPLVIGLSVSSTIDSLGFRTSIKWPNDVYLKGKKLSGTLVERKEGRIIVGTGINVNQKEFPEDLKDMAISLRQVSGREYDRKEVLLRVLSEIGKNLEELKERGFKDFKERIEEKLLFKGEEVIVENGKTITGILKGLSEKGGIILITSEGEKEIISGDVSLRRF